MSVIDTRLRSLLQKLNLSSAVKPANLHAEREAFLHPRSPRRRKSPVFRYENSPLKYAGFDPVLPLETLDAPDEVVEIYQQKQHELDLTKEMFAAVGSDKFTRRAIEIFGAPTAEDAGKAREVLVRLAHVTPLEESSSAREFAKILKTRLEELGISMKITLLSSMATRISVDAASGTICLNKKALFAPQQIQRLLVHEVDAHAVRIHNGACLPWGIFSMGTAGYREAEEGLAVYLEHRSGYLYPFQKKIYAGRCLAVYLSLSAGFAEVFEELRDYFDEKTAYAIVERIKRGLSDTAHAGALTKEFHYFTGPDKIRSYLHSGNDLSMLMGGKIAFKHVQVMAKLVQDGFVDTSKWVFPLEMKDDKKSVPVERCPK
jgi:uncharacterized protein (TIGR02421 family)